MNMDTTDFNHDADWYFCKEDYDFEDNIKWLENNGSLTLTFETLHTFFKIDHTPLDELIHDFCDENLFENILKAKEFFNLCDDKQRIRKARRRANPFDKINSVFFMNRAAIKMANIDAATDFMFSNIDKDVNFHNEKGLIYFADVCGGPGGFSEYMFWRRTWSFKGFGLTLKNDIDFMLCDSCCTSPHSFQAFYGSQGDGDICNPENIADFKEKVLSQTHGKGVHFVTSDGGFSVEGNEKHQEILSRNIYLCQCLVALEILRTHGHFMMKLFDVFTRFSIGLIFMMYKCFKQISILKPVTSRPANSERYLICYDRQDNQEVESIKRYLKFISEEISKFEWNTNLELIPIEILREDVQFLEFIKGCNHKIGEKQIVALKRLHACYNSFLPIEEEQYELRLQCLNYWQIPCETQESYYRHYLQNDKYLDNFVRTEDWIKVPTKLIVDESIIENFYEKCDDWSFCALNSTTEETCYFYAGFYDKTYKWQDTREWGEIDELKLPPGTLLYGEIVHEIIGYEDKTSFESTFHIIDAVSLGNTCLMNLSFNERMNLIQIFAESINQPFDKTIIRVRKKPTYTLNGDTLSKVFKRKIGAFKECFQCTLPTIGYSVVSENYRVNSLLFLKHRGDLTPRSSYVLRIQMDLKESKLYDKLRDVLQERELSLMNELKN